jgi:hypothetical protein
MDIALVRHWLQSPPAPVLAWSWSAGAVQVAASTNTPAWGNYVLLVLMTVFLIGVLVFAWKHREH